MRILLNDTNTITTGSTRVHIYNMGHYLQLAGANVTWNDWTNYKNYDVVIFGKSVPFQRLIESRCQNSNILIGDINPSTRSEDNNKIIKSKLADFFIAGSLEEKDYYLRLKKPVLIFPQFEIFKTKPKIHTDKNEIIIGYHGNKMHIEAMSDEFIAAMNRLHKEFNIKMHLLYNHNALGKAILSGKPRFHIEHIQWTLNNFAEHIQKFDIGVSPSLTKIHTEGINLCKKIPYQGGFPNDYIIRFKNTSNIGRASVFFQLGIPVIADMTPCHFGILSFPGAGYIAMSEEGWYIALNELSGSASKRNAVAKLALHEYNRRYDPFKISKLLLEQLVFIKNQHSQTF